MWITADGEAVLDHDGVVGGRFRRRAIRDVTRHELPAHVPTLKALYAEVGNDCEIALDIKDPHAIAEVIAVARDAGAEDRLWVFHPDGELVATWRPLSDGVHLVESTRLRAIREGLERRLAARRHAGLDALTLHQSDWTGGLVTLVHRFGLLAFGWDAQFERTLTELFDCGIDGVFSDHVDVMVDVFRRFYD